MFEIKGKYNTAKVFTDNVEETAIGQILELCNQYFVEGSKIRIMPDTHAGAGCTIGTTMTIKDKVVPNLVGVDIGCGMKVVQLKERNIELSKLDKIIKERVPSGFDVRDKEHKYSKMIDLKELHCINNVNAERAKLSIGSLGGGNHFIEVDKDDEGKLYLVIHSGSRHLGRQVAEYYQDVAYKNLIYSTEEREQIINKLKAEGREKEIAEELKKLRPKAISKPLAYVEGKYFRDYLEDMRLTQIFASWNREAIANEIMTAMGWKEDTSFTTIHNYIDIDTKILRKGAISAELDEIVIIPINMRDGSIIALGKGKEDWNYSAPHGAGRLMSRSKAKESISMESFKKSMEGVYTTSVNENTIDESAFAYKPMEEILSNIKETVDVVKIIKPIYNFKAGE